MSLPRAKKTFGQNFLVDPTVVTKIIEAAHLKKGETVLEIGPGTGLLTEALVNAGVHVIAVELDHDLIKPLKEKFGDKIELIEGDVLKMEGVRDKGLGVESGKFKLIANIPYNITSPIIEKFLADGPHPTTMILMVQREVADRILAKPGEMSLLSVVCQLYANCSRVTNVKAGAFRPIPKVDSAVVKFEIRGVRGKGQGVNEEGVIAVAKAGFAARRKQLHHNLASVLPGSKPEEIRSLLESINLNPKIRAEELSVTDWIVLEQKIKSQK